MTATAPEFRAAVAVPARRPWGGVPMMFGGAMDYDLLLVVGLTIAVLTIPSLLSAWFDDRPPRTGAILILAAIGLVVIALTQSPKTYTVSGLPHLFVEVLARYMR